MAKVFLPELVVLLTMERLHQFQQVIFVQVERLRKFLYTVISIKLPVLVDLIQPIHIMVIGIGGVIALLAARMILILLQNKPLVLPK
jgi:hypothetical protein